MSASSYPVEPVDPIDEEIDGLLAHPEVRANLEEDETASSTETTLPTSSLTLRCGVDSGWSRKQTPRQPELLVRLVWKPRALRQLEKAAEWSPKQARAVVDAMEQSGWSSPAVRSEEDRG